MTIENSELLRRYVADRSEPAFTSLVERHIDLVYSAALRQVGGDVPAAVLVVGLRLGGDHFSREQDAVTADTGLATVDVEQVDTLSSSAAPEPSGEGVFGVATAGAGLQLEIVTADTGQPVPNARVVNSDAPPVFR